MIPRPTIAGAAGVAAGAGALVGTWLLLARTQRPTYEIRSYVEDTHDAAEGAVSNVRALMTELERTRTASAPLADLAHAYLERAGRG